MKLMAKRVVAETDGAYFLKILMYFIIGSLWVRLSSGHFAPGISSLPVGLIIGLLFAMHDHFQIDRKIEYVVLLAAALLSYLAPIGVVLQI